MAEWIRNLVAAMLGRIGQIIGGTVDRIQKFLCELLGCEHAEKPPGYVTISFGQASPKEGKK